MNPQQLSAAIRLSVGTALKSKETTVAEVVFILETHKASLVQMALTAVPPGPAIQPASILPPHGTHRG